MAFELEDEAVVAGQPARASERQQVVAAAQFPGDLGVAGVIESRDLDVGVERGRPPVAALEIGVPVERDEARAEEIDLVSQDLLGLRLEASCMLSELLWELARGRQVDRRKQEGRRGSRGRHEVLVVRSQSSFAGTPEGTMSDVLHQQ